MRFGAWKTRFLVFSPGRIFGSVGPLAPHPRRRLIGWIAVEGRKEGRKEGRREGGKARGGEGEREGARALAGMG